MKTAYVGKGMLSRGTVVRMDESGQVMVQFAPGVAVAIIDLQPALGESQCQSPPGASPSGGSMTCRWR